MKKILSLLIGLIAAIPSIALACAVCEKNQPAALRGISHGPGPESNWDLVIIVTAAVIVALTLIYSLRYLIKPDENNPNHIKNSVIEK